MKSIVFLTVSLSATPAAPSACHEWMSSQQVRPCFCIFFSNTVENKQLLVLPKRSWELLFPCQLLEDVVILVFSFAYHILAWILSMDFDLLLNITRCNHSKSVML